MDGSFRVFTHGVHSADDSYLASEGIYRLAVVYHLYAHP